GERWVVDGGLGKRWGRKLRVLRRYKDSVRKREARRRFSLPPGLAFQYRPLTPSRVRLLASVPHGRYRQCGGVLRTISSSRGSSLSRRRQLSRHCSTG